jgi:hypothetical protein
VGSLHTSCNPETKTVKTIPCLLNQFGKPVSVFPIDCCGHAALDCAGFTGQCKSVSNLCETSLQVREVIVVGRGRLSGL